MLDRYATQATFFCIGEKAARYPDLCREIVRRGHAVENHSQHHRHHFSLMGRSGIMRELQAAQDTLTTITGQRPLFFRAPAGLRNPFLDPVLARLGLRLASWSARGFDTRIGDAERVKNKLLRGLRAGAILLLHDGNAARTPDGIPVILEVLPAVLAVGGGSQSAFCHLAAPFHDARAYAASRRTSLEKEPADALVPSGCSGHHPACASEKHRNACFSSACFSVLISICSKTRPTRQR